MDFDLDIFDVYYLTSLIVIIRSESRVFKFSLGRKKNIYEQIDICDIVHLNPNYYLVASSINDYNSEIYCFLSKQTTNYIDYG